METFSDIFFIPAKVIENLSLFIQESALFSKVVFLERRENPVFLYILKFRHQTRKDRTRMTEFLG
jgi:hypothetical protein